MDKRAQRQWDRCWCNNIREKKRLKRRGKGRERKSQKNDSIIPNPSLPITCDNPTTPVKRKKKKRKKSRKSFAVHSSKPSSHAMPLGIVYESRTEQTSRTQQVSYINPPHCGNSTLQENLQGPPSALQPRSAQSYRSGPSC